MNRFKLFLGLYATLFIFTLHCISTATAADFLPTVSLDQPTIDCLKTNNWDCALDNLIPLYYEQGAESNLHHYIVHAYRGKARESLESRQYPETAEHLEQALSFTDSDSVLYADLGHVYFLLSDYDAAEEMYIQALNITADNHHYLERLGRIRYLKGDLIEAADYWDQSLSLQPGNAKLRQQLQQITAQAATEQQGTTQLSHQFRITFDQGMNRDIYNDVWQMFENSWYELGQQLDLYPKRQIPVLLLTQEKFTSITDAPSWSAGAYEGQIKIPIAEYSSERVKEVITHEYVHALLYDTMANRCPWWLNEGLAQYFSMEPSIINSQLDKVKEYNQSQTLPDLYQLPGSLKNRSQASVAYSLGLSATDFLFRRFSAGIVRAILFSMGEGLKFTEALERNTGYTFSEFQTMWHNQL